MCIRTLLLYVSIEFIDKVLGAEVNTSNGFDITVSSLVISLVATIGLITVVLMCAGDSKSVKVQHSDGENTKSRRSPAETKPTKSTRSAFQEVKLTNQNHNITVKNYDTNNTSQDGQNVKNNQPHEINDVIARQEKKSVVNLRDNILVNGNHRQEIAIERQHTEDCLTPTQSRSDGRYTTQYYDEDIMSERSVTNEPSVSRHEPQPNNMMNNRMNRNSRENTDDCGYHSDYSRSVKPDSDRSNQNTQRSSQPTSNPRSATTTYDIDDEVIDTYQDDGESFDWS